MGYRSDIRIMTSKEGYEKLKEYNDKYLKEHKEPYNLLDDTKIKYESKNNVYLGWNNVKWYEGSYESVDAIMDSLSKISEEDYSYRFTRIGEEYDDVEEKYYDSESKENGKYIDFPSVLREFEDNYTINQMKQYDKEDIDI